MNQKTLLAIGSIAIIVVGVVLILSALNAVPPPAIPAQVNAPTPAGESSYPEILRVSLGNAKAAYELKQAVFVDVRGQDSHASSHIPGARSIPVAELANRLNELNPADWIITYCT